MMINGEDMPKLILLSSRILQSGCMLMRVSTQSSVLLMRRQRPKVREAVQNKNGTWIWVDTLAVCSDEHQRALNALKRRLETEKIERDIRAGRHNNLGGTQR